uniref:Uncharacterized protein n=1 Tax=Arundo donax TaxID=35708 RepID=A0A0A9CGF5_ARUDO
MKFSQNRMTIACLHTCPVGCGFANIKTKIIVNSENNR